MAWSLAQSLKATSANGGVFSVQATFGSNVTAGNRIILYTDYLRASATGDISTPTDNQGNTYTKLVGNNFASGASTLNVDIWTAVASSTGSLTITVSSPSGAGTGSEIGWTAEEYSGLDASAGSGCLDVSAAGTANNSSTANADSGTTSATTGSGQLAVSMVGDWGSSLTWTVSSGTGFTKNSAASLDVDANADIAAGNRTSASGTAEHCVWGNGANSTTDGAVVAVIKLAAAGGAPAVPQQARSRFRQRRSPRQYARQMPWALSMDAPAAAAPQVLPPHVPRGAARRAQLGRFGACAAGILAATTLSPQPSSVPPARPQPAIAHPAPHRATAKGALATAQLPFTTAKLPPTAISARPPHRAIAKGVLAKTTLSPQPSVVNVLPQPVPVRRPGPHKAQWRLIAGPAPAVVTGGVPSRPQPVTNRPPAPHRAIGKGVLAKTTLSAQPSAVPPSRPQPAIAHPAPHRAIGKGALSQAAPLAPPARPQPAIAHPAPHRAIPVARGIAAPTTFAAQPSRVPPPAWRQPNAPRPPHRATWRGIAGPPPATVVVAAVPPSRPLPTVNRPTAPHRAIARRLLAATTLAAQPSRVPPPQWRPQPRFIAPHRSAWRLIAGQPPAPAPVVPSRPRPVTNRPPAPHRGQFRVLLAKTTLAAQPASVPPPRWQPQPRLRRPHRAAWRVIAGPAPTGPPPSVNATSIPAVTAPDASTASVRPGAASAAAVTGRRSAPSVTPSAGGAATVTSPGASAPAVSDG